MPCGVSQATRRVVLQSNGANLGERLREVGGQAGRRRVQLVKRDPALFFPKDSFVPRLRTPVAGTAADESDPLEQPGVSSPLHGDRDLLQAAVERPAQKPEARRRQFVRRDAVVAHRAQKQPEARQAEAFGMDSNKLMAQKREGFKRFDGCYALAKKRHDAKLDNEHYEQRKKTFVDEQGRQWPEFELLRTKKTRTERFMDGQALRGKKAQAGLNQLGQRARELAGPLPFVGPREYGSNYLSNEGTEGLLSINKTLALDRALAAQSAIKMGNGSVTATGAELGNAEIAGVAGPINDMLALGAPVLAVGDAMASIDACLKLRTDRDKAKATLLRSFQDARRFWTYLEKATPQEAEAYLQFEAAAEKLFDETQEDRSTRAAAKDRAARLAVIQPPAVAATMGAEIANDVIGAAAVNPIAGAVLAPLAMVSGAIDVHEGTHERLRRLDQQQRAEQRKVAMNRVLESTAVDHPQHALMVGIVKSLSAHQDRLIKQAKREKGYGKARAGKGGAVIGASAAVVATAGLVIGGIVSVATLGVASALALLPPLGWGIAQAERNRRRVKDEHKSKWRQRAMRVLGFEMSREALQKKLAGTHPDSTGRLRVEFQEGEYLPKDQRFAGSRTMEFDAGENEYLPLHLLSLQVQDLVRDGRCDHNAPYVQLLKAVGIDAIQLLAICKAASAKPANAQLDFIQSQLAPALGIKLRVEAGVQALPHVSIFINHYWDAVGAVINRKGQDFVDSAEGPAEIRRQLAERYPDQGAGMKAFDTVIGTFLEKTQHLPPTPHTKALRDVLTVPVKPASPRPVAVTPRIPQGG